MKTMIAFTKKEFTEQIRSGKLYIVGVLFVLFGIMNPAMAKLTPWIMEMASESLEEAGLSFDIIAVDDLTSWTQFYKNIAIFMIVFIVLYAGILSNEYQRGTLINVLTKGLPRVSVLAAKSISLYSVWTLVYWMGYGITFAYNAYFWGNEVSKNILFAAFCYYLYGVFFITMLMLGSVLTKTNTGAILFTGGTYITMSLLDFLAKVKEFNPLRLGEGFNLITASTEVSDYVKAIAVMACVSVVAYIIGIVQFNKKNL